MSFFEIIKLRNHLLSHQLFALLQESSLLFGILCGDSALVGHRSHIDILSIRKEYKTVQIFEELGLHGEDLIASYLLDIVAKPKNLLLYVVIVFAVSQEVIIRFIMLVIIVNFSKRLTFIERGKEIYEEHIHGVTSTCASITNSLDNFNCRPIFIIILDARLEVFGNHVNVFQNSHLSRIISKTWAVIHGDLLTSFLWDVSEYNTIKIVFHLLFVLVLFQNLVTSSCNRGIL